MGEEFIAEREHYFCREAIKAFRTNPNMIVLGNLDAERLPIIPFLIRYEGTFLHYNFVAALLNDLFGIQCRGGCACAGPYVRK